MTTATSKPKTCAALNVTHPEFGSPTCKRLPRHKGDCRKTLKAPAIVRAPRVTADGKAVARKAPRRMSAAKRREFAVSLAAQVESGAITASQAMAKFAARVR